MLPPDGDWLEVLEIANRGWLAPALFLALKRCGHEDALPPSVREYLAFLHEQNRERNRRLLEQLFEAVAALNAAGIEPVLLKGAIHLFTAQEEELGARMISDLDLCLQPEDMARATSALVGLDYACFDAGRELSRPTDAGAIDFHGPPSARSARYLSKDVRAACTRISGNGATALVPSATARALHLIVHDMIKEGDYWSFRLDLRHLYDLALLARSDEGIAWRDLWDVLDDRAGRQALVLQCRALEDLFGIVIPPELRAGRAAELKHAMRLIGSTGGRRAALVRLTGNVSRGFHNLTHQYVWHGYRRFFRHIRRRLTARGAGSRL
jgi:hypothetical protein